MKNILISIIIGVLTVSCEKQPKAEMKPIEQVEVAVITTQYGDMVVNFFDQAAPMHVESFKAHAKSGYYNGTIFHRVIPGFVIQGGDPNTKGDDKSRYGMGGNAFIIAMVSIDLHSAGAYAAHSYGYSYFIDSMQTEE